MRLPHDKVIDRISQGDCSPDWIDGEWVPRGDGVNITRIRQVHSFYDMLGDRTDTDVVPLLRHVLWLRENVDKQTYMRRLKDRIRKRRLVK